MNYVVAGADAGGDRASGFILLRVVGAGAFLGLRLFIREQVEGAMRCDWCYAQCSVALNQLMFFHGLMRHAGACKSDHGGHAGAGAGHERHLHR